MAFLFVDKEMKKEIKEYEKKLLQDKKDKEMLLSKKANWTLLEKLIQECNRDPDLRVSISLRDGTNINMKTYKEERKNVGSFINGNYMEIK